MNAQQAQQDRVADWLLQMGLADFTATSLEAAGPLTVVGAQLVYLFEPLFSDRHGIVRGIAATLEDDRLLKAFIARLREEAQP